jgi:alcohol dehydrogenase (cytochrome c)
MKLPAILCGLVCILTAQPGSWPTYSGRYDGRRYSPLKGIDRANVARLRPAWIYQTADLNPFEATPIVSGGVMYISEPPSHAAAIDLRTGRPIWMFRRSVPSDVGVCCGQVNRGVAMAGDRVFLGTLDAHLLALDAKTGHLLWDRTVADYKSGYSITAAPLTVKGAIIVGISGGEYGIRGFIDAYDAKSGDRLWRFWTVPAPGEAGHETWAGDSWKTGSAATWVTGSYDPALNLIYWGTGNPGPDYNGDIRGGDNLYSASLLALDVATRKLKWHFQFTPHDTHDWDANHVPVLIDGVFRDRPRKVVAVANRNGFFYLLDGRTGEFLLGRPYARQTWAKGLDDKGRPVLAPNIEPKAEGTVVYPGLHGATNWNSPSYSPETRLLYVASARRRRFFTVPPRSTNRGATSLRAGCAAFQAWSRPARSKHSIPSRERCAGSSRCILRPGRVCSRRPAAWFSAAPMKEMCSRSTPRPGSRYGIFRPVRRSIPHRSATSLRDGSTSRFL